MVEGAEVVGIGGSRVGGGGMLGNGLVALGHQLGNGLEQGAVRLDQVLDRRDEFLPLALRERNDIIRTEILYIHDVLVPVQRVRELRECSQ